MPRMSASVTETRKLLAKIVIRDCAEVPPLIAKREGGGGVCVCVWVGRWCGEGVGVCGGYESGQRSQEFSNLTDIFREIN